MAFVQKSISLLLVMLLVTACSVTKFVPEGKMLLNSVNIVSHHNKDMAIKAQSYIRQRPNSRLFSLVRMPLYTYSLAGHDSTKWINRVLQRIGEEPVIFSEEHAERTRQNIEQMLRNEGFLHATVDMELRSEKEKRMDVYLFLNEQERFVIDKISHEIDDTMLRNIIDKNADKTLLTSGMLFSVDKLESERRRIVSLLRENGYYRFQKDYITFVADTARHSRIINLKMKILPFKASPQHAAGSHPRYMINSISYVCDAGMRLNDNVLALCDTLHYKNNCIYHKNGVFFRPNVFLENTFVKKGGLYSQNDVDKTYNSFSQLSALRYASVRMVESADSSLLDCYIMLERNKRCSVSFELEGTNTAGDLGAAASVTFTDKNLFKGSEMLSLRLFGAYEAISGLSGYTRDSYYEYGAELSLRLFGGVFSSLLPFNEKLQKSSTLLSLKFDSQERPEFDRQILSGSWSYIWSKSPQTMHKLDIMDINYIYVPWISDTFKKEYLDSISNRHSILKYNYENLLITKLGYSYSYNSSHKTGADNANMTFAIRTNIECSGNLLRGMNKLFGGHKNSDGQYTFMNIAYAQYVKGDIDFTTNIRMDDRNSLLFHMGLGVAYPYGNSGILPFEKRYFAGGANSLRGWTVRGLGPGRYKSKDSNIDFINQSGDMKLDFSVEFRTRLFWKLHSAIFIDAGNIWTLRYYDEQPEGQFDINNFYKDIAFSYGMGLRFEFDLFVFRLDAGMKAVNPAYRGKDKYPLLKPDIGRDFALHFAIGYPF